MPLVVEDFEAEASWGLKTRSFGSQGPPSFSRMWNSSVEFSVDAPNGKAALQLCPSPKPLQLAILMVRNCSSFGLG